MANWQRHLELQPDWGRCRDGEIAPAEMAAIIARRLKAIRPFDGSNQDVEETRLDLIATFEDIARDETADDDDLDGIMHELYDWGDTRLDSDWNGKKVCWVNTAFSARASIPPPPHLLKMEKSDDHRQRPHPSRPGSRALDQGDQGRD